MEHYIQKFADGSSCEMVRAFASIPFIVKGAGMSDEEFSELIESSPMTERDLQLAEYREAVRRL